MPNSEQQLRDSIIQVGRWCWEKGWVAANDGNLSVRLDPERILCTPTGVSKGMMAPGDLIIVDPEGRKLSGSREKTTELSMHLAIYALRPDVNAIVHCHPPVATGFAAAGRTLNQAVLPEVIVALGCVPLAAYGLPGTEELTRPMLPFIPKYNAILLQNHGATCYGEDLARAFSLMETVEHSARITLVAELLGGPRLLNRHEVKKLFEARGRYGVHAHNRMEPGWPLVAEDVAEAPASSGGITASNGGITKDDLREIIEEALRAKGLV